MGVPRAGGGGCGQGAHSEGRRRPAPAQPWNYFDKPVALDPFRKWSPMLSIKNAKTPTLVIHSQRDYRLDVSEGLQLFTALQRLNVPSKMLYFPDEGHWVLKPQNSKLWYETVGDWCDRWTKTNAYAATGSESPAMPVAKAKAKAPDARMGQSRPAGDGGDAAAADWRLRRRSAACAKARDALRGSEATRRPWCGEGACGSTLRARSTPEVHFARGVVRQ